MRRLRVVASMALIIMLAAVAVPAPAGSRAPTPIAAADTGLFRPVEALSLTRGTTTTVQPPDPGARSAGTLDERSKFIEPAPRTEPIPAPVRDAQPAPKPGVVAIPTPTPRVEPAPKSQPAANSRSTAKSQPAAKQVIAAGGGWRSDREASWYGPGFYGNRTACGQTMTRGLVGVAHKSLACGTRVAFRNPANGRTLVVPVVDRGPYVAGRNWDLTAGACQILGHCYTGPIQWRIGG